MRKCETERALCLSVEAPHRNGERKVKSQGSFQERRTFRAEARSRAASVASRCASPNNSHTSLAPSVNALWRLLFAGGTLPKTLGIWKRDCCDSCA